MAITDHTFTLEEIDAAVATNPQLKDHLVGSIKKLGYTPYTQPEYEAAVGKVIGEKTKEIYDNFDRDIAEATGFKKEGTEKTYDFNKRVLATLKKDATDRQTKIADLEKSIAEGSGNATMQAQLADLQKKEADYQKTITDKDTQLFQKDVKLDIRDGLRDLTFDPSVKDSVKKVMINNATDQILAMATTEKDAAGKESIRYVRNGEVVLHKGQPATAADLLTEQLADLLDAGHQGQGGGSKGDPTPPRVGPDGKVIVPAARPATLKNQGDVLDWLIKLGVPQNTDEFDKAFDTHAKGLPMRS